MPSSCIAQLLRNCSGCSRVFCYSYLVYGQLHARIGGIHAKCQHVHPQRPHAVRARHESAAQRAHDADVRVAAQELAVPVRAASRSCRKEALNSNSMGRDGRVQRDGVVSFALVRVHDAQFDDRLRTRAVYAQRS